MGLFTGIRCIGGKIHYPFAEQGDTTTKIYKLTCICDPDDYTPGDYDDTMDTPANAGVDVLPTSFSDVDAFWVIDSTPESFQGSLVKFTREFANIPQDRIEPNGFYAFEFPDVPGGIFLEKTSISKTISYNPSNFILTLTATFSAADAAEFIDGEYLVIKEQFLHEFQSGSTFAYGQIGGQITKSSNTITIQSERAYLNNGIKTAWASISDLGATNYDVQRVISPDRNSTAQINSPSIIDYRYIKTNNVENLSLRDQWVLQRSDGIQISQTSSTTQPLTTDTYRLAALNREYAIEAENESVQRWKGNIYELSQIKVQPR